MPRLIILLSVTALHLCLNASGQIRCGLKGGGLLADVVINNVVNHDLEDDFDIKAGVHVGVFFTLDLDERSGLGVELLYADKGVRAIHNVHLHYAAIPILGRYRIDNRLILEAGPEVAYLVAARSQLGNLNYIWNNPIDLGLDLGIQYDSGQRFLAGIRFNAGITSVIRGEGGSGAEARYQNRVLQLYVGWVVRTL